MPQSRKRPGHHEHQEPAAIPGSQRTKGRTLWAILFAVFALVIAFFASGSYPVLIAAAVIGAAIGYAIGKSMERDA